MILTVPKTDEERLRTLHGFIFIGIIGFVAGAIIFFFTWTKHQWPVAQASVEDFQLVSSEKGSDTYQLSYRFEVDGKSYSHREIVWSKNWSKVVPVHYNPTNPNDVTVQPDDGSIAAFAVMGFSVFFALMGIVGRTLILKRTTEPS